MSKLEYLFTFIAMILALGVSDILVSLHRMLKIRREIRWHWIPLAWACILFMAILNIWFALHHYLDDKLTESAAGFVFLLLPVIFIMLLCLAIFPDDPENEEKDLLQWYFKQKNYIFILFLLNLVSFVFMRAFEQIHLSGAINPNLLTLLIPVALYVVLLSTRNIWVHSIITVFYFFMFVLTIMDTPMTLT